MFALLICILSLHGVHSSCNVPPEEGICTEDPDVQALIVNLHNYFRSNVQPPAKNMLKMRYSAEVAASAQAWVDKCHLEHGPNTSRIIRGYELGENLHESTQIKTWTEVINGWFNERGLYTYPREATNPTGHYTQLVWFSSYEVGCGVQLCNDVYFYGCHYYRAGNFQTLAPYEEGASCESCLGHCDGKLCTNPCPFIDHFLNCPEATEVSGCEGNLSELCTATCVCSDDNKIIAKY